MERKKISFILYSGGGEAPQAVSMLKNKYSNSTIYEIKEPKKNLSKVQELMEEFK